MPASAGDTRDAGSIPGLGRFMEEGMATHSSLLAWRITRTEEPGRLQPIGSQRVEHNWSDLAHTTVIIPILFIQGSICASYTYTACLVIIHKYNLSYFSNDLFLDNLKIHTRTEERYRDFSYTLCYQTCIASPIINIPHQSGTLYTIDEHTLTYHYHPNFTAYIMVHSGLYDLWVWKLYTNMCLSLWYLLSQALQPLATTHLLLSS